MSRPFFTAAVLLLALGAAPSAASAEEGAGWDYEIAADAEVTRLTVALTLRGFAPKRLVLDPDAAWGAVKFAPQDGGGPTLERDLKGGGYVVSGSRGRERITYEVDVAGALSAHARGMEGGKREEAVLLSVGAILARPAVVPPGWRGRATVRLPEGVSLSAPWPKAAGGGYELDESVFAYPGHVAIGRFASRFDVEAAGATFDVAVLKGERWATDAGIGTWIAKAAETAAILYGEFPQKRVQVVVQPWGMGGEPVVFGSGWRGGGPALLLYLAANAEDKALPGEWVAVHEMIHLGHPVMSVDDAWFIEGFTTYYQEVLRARAGWRTPEEAWARMEEGFAAGAKTKHSLTIEESSRRMHETHEYRRVYWAGAAIALRADVLLRRSEGLPARSFDDVMRWIRGTYDGRPGVRTAREVLGGVDQWLGRPTLLPLVEACLASTDFPDVSAVRRFLGFVPAGKGKVTRLPSAEGASIASAIFGR